jgi:hypothetical protein
MLMYVSVKGTTQIISGRNFRELTLLRTLSKSLHHACLLSSLSR